MKLRFIAFGFASIMATQACRTRKESPPAPVGPTPAASASASVSGYGALVGSLREAGLSDESHCEEDPWSEEEQRKFREGSAKTLAKLRSRDRGATLSVTELSKMEDRVFVGELRTRLFDKVIELGTRKLTPTERALWLYDALEGEVNNGGFHQYFSNSSGDCAMEVRAAVRAMGETELSKLYERALAVFPSSRPAADREARNEQMSRIPNEYEAWRSHDSAFYAMKDRDRIVGTFLRAHLGELQLPPRSSASGQ